MLNPQRTKRKIPPSSVPADLAAPASETLVPASHGRHAGGPSGPQPQRIPAHNERLAHPARLERAASTFGGWRSIHLSYGCGRPLPYAVRNKRSIRGWGIRAEACGDRLVTFSQGSISAFLSACFSDTFSGLWRSTIVLRRQGSEVRILSGAPFFLNQCPAWRAFRRPSRRSERRSPRRSCACRRTACRASSCARPASGSPRPCRGWRGRAR